MWVASSENVAAWRTPVMAVEFDEGIIQKFRQKSRTFDAYRKPLRQISALPKLQIEA
jgi:hypothetical protein